MTRTLDAVWKTLAFATLLVGCVAETTSELVEEQAPLPAAAELSSESGARRKAEPLPIVLIHGAWHGGWAWHDLQDELDRVGVKSHVIDLPGHGIDVAEPGAVQLADYVNRAEWLLDTLPGRAVVVAHSMGGIVLSSLAEKRPEKIDTSVYLAAFLVPSGKSMLDLALADSASLVGPNLIVNPPAGFIDIERDDLRNIFYGQSPRSEVYLAESLLRPNPIAPLATPLSLTDGAYGSVPRVYVRTDDDHAVSPEAQEAMLAEQPCERTYTMHSDHSPFFSHPRELAHLLRRISLGHR